MRDFFENIYYKITGIIGNIKTWFRYYNNRYYWRFMKSAFDAAPFQASDMLYVERSFLEYVLNHMNKRLYTTDETYDYMIKWIKVAIELNKIISNCTDLFHYDGELEYEPWEDNPKLTRVITDGLIYCCDVNVNLNNINRFTDNERMIKRCQDAPHELYILKAKKLYYNILATYLESWWD